MKNTLDKRSSLVELIKITKGQIEARTEEHLSTLIQSLSEYQAELVEIDQQIEKDMISEGSEKFVGYGHSISFRRSQRLVIHDESKVPEEYLTRKETVQVDKKKLEYYLKEGAEIDYAAIETIKTIKIQEG